MTDQTAAVDYPLTRRPTVPALDQLLGQAFPVLDHGFVRPIDYMGNDAAIVQAARVSYGSGTKTATEDRGLIRYMMRHKHGSPFEMASIKFHMKLPIFVARQMVRHRTASLNEMSARYSVLDCEFYIPAPEDIAAQSATNKQGRGERLDPGVIDALRNSIKVNATESYDSYETALEAGLARELARMNLTLNTYTQWYWKIDLRNLFGFLALRMDSHAQKEIRVYADAIAQIVKAWVPMAWEAFEEYQLHAFTLSRGMVSVVSRMLAGEQVTQVASGLTKREWNDLKAELG